MPDVLREYAPPVANELLRSGLSPDEIDLVRKLVGHTHRVARSNVVSFARRWLGAVGIEPTLPMYSAYRSAPCATRFTCTNIWA